SQALEADALHFSTDIWSSAVVIAGLLVVRLSQSFQLPAWFAQADAIAALGVSAIVIWVSLRLLRVTVDALLDRAPDTLVKQVESSIAQVEGVTEVRRIRERRAGNKLFADVVIGAPRTYTFEQIHTLSEQVEQAAIVGAHAISPQSDVDVLVHVEPTASPGETLIDQIHYLAELQGVHAHDIHAREVNGRLEADFDIEVHADVDLQEAHQVASRLEQAILQNNPLVGRVTTHLEAPVETIVRRKDVTQHYTEMAEHIVELADVVAGKGSAHDVHLYQPSTTQLDHINSSGNNKEELDLVLHTFFDPHIPLSQAHIQAEEIKRSLRKEYPNLGSIAIHTEPPE
ncbi:MAG TPA: cation transporter dimerization domain-containing protein, partial [Ktedonobacteraceae bacterium]|nr:cation transporter dimerization domain-containing protein [Ktedonobacteraceae bacterium]